MSIQFIGFMVGLAFGCLIGPPIGLWLLSRRLLDPVSLRRGSDHGGNLGQGFKQFLVRPLLGLKLHIKKFFLKLIGKPYCNDGANDDARK